MSIQRINKNVFVTILISKIVNESRTRSSHNLDSSLCTLNDTLVVIIIAAIGKDVQNTPVSIFIDVGIFIHGEQKTYGDAQKSSAYSAQESGPFVIAYLEKKESDKY